MNLSRDEVKSALHYKGATLSLWQVYEDFGLTRNHYLATAIKYIIRCEKKGSKIKDLSKAIEYLKREIEIS